MPEWFIALASALLGGGVSVLGAYAARRREHSLAMRHEIYREDLLEVADGMKAALSQVSSPPQTAFATLDIMEPLRRAERKAATGSRWDRRELRSRLEAVASYLKVQHEHLYDNYGTKYRQGGSPQAFRPEYFDGAEDLLTQCLAMVEGIEDQLSKKV